MLKKLLTILLIFALVSGCSNNTNDQQYEHTFSISEDTKVYIASGNLQYNPALKMWRFAQNSYDIIGKDNELASVDYDGWLDLFCWGASGLSGVDPSSTVYDNALYGDGFNSIANTKYDFAQAYNKQTGENWRMFTHDEIHYLLMFRDNAEELFGYGKVNGIKGLFILPDDWQCPQDITFVPSVKDGFENQYDWYYTNVGKDNYINNIYTIDEYTKLEAAGAIFLPAAGIRYNNACERTGESGHYWTSSYYGKNFANSLCLFENDLFLEGNFDRSCALSIRLIKEVK